MRAWIAPGSEVHAPPPGTVLQTQRLVWAAPAPRAHRTQSS
jgi:hypothetical protein